MAKSCNNCRFELYNPDEIPCKDCGMDNLEYWMPKTKTNADRIRAMSDEELACTMYAASGMDDEAIGFCKNLPKCRDILNSGQLIPDEDCTACMLDWLRQPVKEESK